MTMWKVTAGRSNAFVDAFVAGGFVAIGWREAGDPTVFGTKAELLAAFRSAYTDDSARQIEVGAGQVWRFLKEMKVGDQVVTYDPETRLYHRGEIVGEPIYRPALLRELPTQRAVMWKATRSRDALAIETRNSLGAIMTLFRLSDEAATDLIGEVPAPPFSAKISSGPAAPVEENVSLAESDPYSSIADQALERTKDRISRLDWDEMQELVAALLRALGYRTIVSPAGSDRGKDIVASRDGFGFERPRIVVEVKHRKDPMGAQEIRSFLGGRHADDRGLYVSTGGFTKDAMYEAERASTVTHLMTLDGLARAVIEQYETMDERGRQLLRMTKIYWPA